MLSEFYDMSRVEDKADQVLHPGMRFGMRFRMKMDGVGEGVCCPLPVASISSSKAITGVLLFSSKGKGGHGKSGASGFVSKATSQLH